MMDPCNIFRVAAKWWADRLQQGDREAFANALQDEMQLQYKDPYLTVKTDYDPDSILHAALNRAGIKVGRCMYSCDGVLPRKTFMLIELDRIEVAEGYGGKWYCVCAACGKDYCGSICPCRK